MFNLTSIKEKFPEFFQKKLETKDLNIGSNNLIVLDTNFLLDIIQKPTKVAERYIESLERVKNNLYIPYLVALEFNFRKSGIKKEKHYNITKYKDNIIKSLDNLKDNVLSHSVINIEKDTKEFSGEMVEEINVFKEKILGILDKKIATAITEEENTIYEKLIHIIENKIGEKYTQEWIDEIEEMGEERYENKIPPGFDDAEKEVEGEKVRRYGNIQYQRKFGDLIIWKDIIKYAQKDDKIGPKVIYVTDDGRSDKKNDLLYKVKNLTVGPHIFLMNELQMEAQKELYILSNLRFIQVVTDLSDAEMEEIESLSNKENELKELYLFQNKLSKTSVDKRNSLIQSYLKEIIREKINQEKGINLEKSIAKKEFTKRQLLEELGMLEKYSVDYNDNQEYKMFYEDEKHELEKKIREVEKELKEIYREMLMSKYIDNYSNMKNVDCERENK